MSLLDEAIADSKVLREASVNAAMEALKERYSEDIRRAVDEILEQGEEYGDLFDVEPDAGVEPVEDADDENVLSITISTEVDDQIPLAATDINVGEEGEEIEISFNDLEAALSSETTDDLEPDLDADPRPLPPEPTTGEPGELDDLDDDIREALLDILQGEVEEGCDKKHEEGEEWHGSIPPRQEEAKGYDVGEYAERSWNELVDFLESDQLEYAWNVAKELSGDGEALMHLDIPRRRIVWTIARHSVEDLTDSKKIAEVKRALRGVQSNEQLVDDPEIKQAAAAVPGPDVNKLFHQWLVAWGSDDEASAAKYGKALYQAVEAGETPAVWSRVPHMKGAFEEWLRGALQEEIDVDIEPGKTTGWLGKSDADIHHKDVVIATKAAAAGAVKEAMTRIVPKYEKTIKILKENVDKLLLENSILIYSNRALSDNSLNERQKSKFVETIAKASTVQEAKIIYETVSNSVSAKHAGERNALVEAVERKSSFRYNRALDEQTAKRDDPAFVRMKKLAGINN